MGREVFYCLSGVDVVIIAVCCAFFEKNAVFSHFL
jgi:hypothetical protein